MTVTFNDILTQANTALRADRPFVLYAKPGENMVTAIFQRDNKTYPIDYTQAGFIFCSFDNNRQFFIPNAASETIKVEIPESAAPPLTNPSPSFTIKAKKAFETLVKKGVGAILAGKMGKVVLSRKETVSNHTDFVTVYTRLLLTYPDAFRYCWFHPQTGVWMGATPERLLKTDGKTFSTVALAGTQQFIDTEHVLWQEKEKEEQRFVTDFIVDGLRGETSEINLSEPYTVRAGNLLHIKTDIGGTFAKDSVLEKAIEILHPTPAVCGYPKPDAQKFIRENEGYNREFYSGYLGETAPAASDLYVNLRCMKVEQNSAHLYIGCGITAASNPSKEFDETVSKALTMKKVLS
jgi:isochorismate synthase